MAEHLVFTTPCGLYLRSNVSETKVVEQSDAVGLRPNPDTSRPGYVRIVGLDEDLAVERNKNPVTRELRAQGMPLILRHWRVDVLDRDSTPFLRAIERNVVLQGVGAGDVVVSPSFQRQTTPRASSSLPDTGLNLTSTYPSAN